MLWIISLLDDVLEYTVPNGRLDSRSILPKQIQQKQVERLQHTFLKENSIQHLTSLMNLN